MGSGTDLDRALFFGLWMRRPLDIAAVLPSGRPVGDACARHIDRRRPGWVVELGAGTGSLTQRLIGNGCPTERIVAIEREAELVDCLRRSVPGLRVIKGDVTELAHILPDAGIDRIAGVLSSLPIKWFPLAAQRAVLEPCFARMADDGRFLQITNAFASPLPAARLGLVGSRIALIWRNVPPVQLWSYRRPLDLVAT
jgi:phosphatidylethanolamine/phosphatidyl-N-methylethanolamine N-methyltransferase